MIRKIPKITLPQWSGESSLQQFVQWRTQLTRVLKDAFATLVEQINTQVQGVGEDLTIEAGGSSHLQISAAIHHVGGTGTIQYIDPPTDSVGTSDTTTASSTTSFTGPLFVIPTEVFSVANTGTGPNRFAGPNTTAVVGKLMVFVFDGERWYSSY